MKIIEWFNSIEGEGKRSGELSTFIRTLGCNLKCDYCDTKYSWKADKDTMELSPKEVLSVVDNIGCPNVTITGGEPLVSRDIKELVELLLDNFYQVNIETNGTIDPYSVLSSKSLVNDGLFFTMDYKTISSGYNNQMNIKAFEHLQYKDVVKCVVGTREDILDSVRFINTIYEYKNLRNRPSLYLSPIFGMIEPKEIVEIMKELNLSDWKLQLQIHKYIYPVDARGV